MKRKEAEKEPLRPEWLDFWRKILDELPPALLVTNLPVDAGTFVGIGDCTPTVQTEKSFYLCPSGGYLLLIDRGEKKVSFLAGRPDYFTSDLGILDARCITTLGYNFVRYTEQAPLEEVARFYLKALAPFLGTPEMLSLLKNRPGIHEWSKHFLTICLGLISREQEPLDDEELRRQTGRGRLDEGTGQV